MIIAGWTPADDPTLGDTWVYCEQVNIRCVIPVRIWLLMSNPYPYPSVWLSMSVVGQERGQSKRFLVFSYDLKSCNEPSAPPPDLSMRHVRRKHCGYCKKCVTGYDHHCWFLNTCIGDWNYRSFAIIMLVMW